MIICSCNVINDCQIRKCINDADKPTVGRIFKQLNCKPECATCVKSIINLINEEKGTGNTFQFGSEVYFE